MISDKLDFRTQMKKNQFSREAACSAAVAHKAPLFRTDSLTFGAILNRVMVMSVCLGTIFGGEEQLFAQDADKIRQAPVVNLQEFQSIPVQPILGTDIDGHAFDLRRYAAGQPVVVALTSTSCPLCKKYGPTLAQLEKDYAKKGVKFLFIGAITSDSLAEAKSTRDRLGLQGPYLLDPNGSMLQQLNAKSTTEAFLLDRHLNVVYRGAVDDQYGLGYTKPVAKNHYLKDAIDDLISQQEISVPMTSAPGCVIAAKEETAESQLEYYRDIFPIVQNHCVTCHRTDGVAPFALETPEQLIAHAGMVNEVVSNKTMPPWFAEDDQENPNKWMNKASLPQKERQQLLAWLDGDQKIGATSETLVKRQFPSRWTIGTPDLVVKLPRKVPVQASGFMDYIHMKIELDGTEDRWIEAVEVRPTSPDVVHHVLVYHMDKSTGRVNIDESSHFLAAYAPGNNFVNYPAGFGKRLPGNSDLIVQMHYTPNGNETTDQTEIAFRFCKEKPKHEVYVKGIADTRLSIPPGADNHQEQTTFNVPVDTVALAFFPHMHLRGKAFQFQLIQPDNSVEELLNIPAYDFNWQLEYRLQNPISIPKGSSIRVTGWFDNSENNPANPDPEVMVRWGEQTFDEMLIGYVEYYLDTGSSSANNQGAKRNRSQPEN